jgi:molybdopterin converting factor subunit 1
MQIRVLYFASVRDRVGRGEETLSLPPSIRTVHDLAGHLTERHPEIAVALPGLRFARNERFADPTDLLADDDVVALIPPVSGG